MPSATPEAFAFRRPFATRATLVARLRDHHYVESALAKRPYDTTFVFASENEGGAGLICEGRGHLGESDREEEWCCRADAAGEHHRQAHRARDAAVFLRGFFWRNGDGVVL